MNMDQINAASTYKFQWKTFTGSTEFLTIIGKMNAAGLGNPFAENILEVAFAAGWTAAVSAAEHVVEKVIDSKKKAPNE